MSRLVVPLLALLVLGFAPGTALAQGVPLGPEFQVNTYTVGTQGRAAVAVDGSGNFVVVWESYEQDGSNTGVYGQRYSSSGAPLGSEFRVNTETASGQIFPSVAADTTGGFVVVWTGTYADVFGQRYSSSGAPLGPEFRVNTYTTGIQIRPCAAADGSGNFVVVWSSFPQDADSEGIFGQRFSSAGAPLGPEFRVNTYTTENQRYPAVAADASGDFVVVWSLPQEPASDVFAQRFSSSGAPLGPEFRVNTYTTETQHRPAVAADASGRFVVLWTSGAQDGSVSGVYGQRYSDTGDPLGPEFRVNTYTTSIQHDPSAAADASGDFVVAWTSYSEDGGPHGSIFGQRFSSAGAPLGPEFRVNSFTTNHQQRASVAGDASGDFVVVWDSDLQDGSAIGTFGQRFSPMVPMELTGFGVE